MDDRQGAGPGDPVSRDPETVESGRQQYRDRHCIELQELLDPELGQMLLAHLRDGDFYVREHSGIGRRLEMTIVSDRLPPFGYPHRLVPSC